MTCTRLPSSTYASLTTRRRRLPRASAWSAGGPVPSVPVLPGRLPALCPRKLFVHCCCQNTLWTTSKLVNAVGKYAFLPHHSFAASFFSRAVFCVSTTTPFLHLERATFHWRLSRKGIAADPDQIGCPYFGPSLLSPCDFFLALELFFSCKAQAPQRLSSSANPGI